MEVGVVRGLTVGLQLNEMPFSVGFYELHRTLPYFLHRHGLAVKRHPVAAIDDKADDPSAVHGCRSLLRPVDSRKPASQPPVEIHGGCNQEEYQQHERDVSCRSRIQPRDAAFLLSSEHHLCSFL